jgi:hypothetical protein
VAITLGASHSAGDSTHSLVGVKSPARSKRGMQPPTPPGIVRLESFEGPDAAGALERPKARAPMRRGRLAQSGGGTAESSPRGMRGPWGRAPLPITGEPMVPPWAPSFAARRRSGFVSLPAGEAGLRRPFVVSLEGMSLARLGIKVRAALADGVCNSSAVGTDGISLLHESGGRDLAALPLPVSR